MNQHYKRFSFDYFLDCQEECGVESIELWAGASHLWLDDEGFEDPKQLLKKVREHGMKIVSFCAPSCAYQWQYGRYDPWMREKAFRYFSNGLRLAAECGATVAVCNSGWGYQTGDADRFERVRDMLGQLAELARSLGIVMAMESLRHEETNIALDLESTMKLFKAVNHPNLKAMVDTGAVQDAHETVRSWLDAFGKDLVHMHFLDSIPAGHNAWGDNQTPVEKMMTMLAEHDYQGYLTQEITNPKYQADPFAADRLNYRTLWRFLDEDKA